MTKRDFFILLIKLFGLHSIVISIFSVLPNNIAFAFQQVDIVVIIWTIVVIAIIVGLFWLLVFEADKVVDLMKLGKGFTDDRIDLGNIKSSDIIKTGTFIIGGLMIVDHIPGLLSQIFWAFKGDIVGQEFTSKDKFNLTVSGLNVLMGYLLVTNLNFVSRRLTSKKNVE
jgi:hypothetical protein